MSASCLIAVKPGSASDVVAENSWVSKTPMQVARSYLGVAAVDGKVYAIGGKAETGLVNINEEYDPLTDTWSFKKPMPTPREVFAIAVYQNKIYYIGGRTNNGIIGVNEVYDPVVTVG